jgi:hypothetical protein
MPLQRGALRQPVGDLDSYVVTFSPDKDIAHMKKRQEKHAAKRHGVQKLMSNACVSRKASRVRDRPLQCAMRTEFKHEP